MKRVLTVILSLIFILALVGCGTQKNEGSTSKSEDKTTIKIGASPQPHKEILEKVKPILKKAGYDLEIVEFTDYVTPNKALESGEIDANFFQHTPFLEEFNKKNKTNLVSVAKVHIEPLGFYSSKIKSLSELKDGAQIAIPNDATNGARALKLLAKEGLIKVKDGDTISKLDITENKKNLNIQEVDAPQLPRILADVDGAVINTNYALEANLNPTKDAIAIESKDSPYANIIAVRNEDKDKPYIKALAKAVNDEQIRKFINENYKGSIIPAF
ncbi:MetQ/NlpA family ABC transporter substrate-binding protein [Clostridium sp. BJN0013]|mgnify:CR=1 FL=1|uniref:MetQ/NlpA family ABC transporter substrate-binding protein n=1 Tax=Clostridium sp. BJN0013 TaxID=3236840 RepID=UPI0034C6056B